MASGDKVFINSLRNSYLFFIAIIGVTGGVSG